MKIEDWIKEENLFPVLTAIAWLCHYSFDEDDRVAFEAGILNVDLDNDKWFDYVFNGKGEIKIAVSKEIGGSDYNLIIDAPLPIEQAVNMAIDIAQHFLIIDQRHPRLN